MISTIISDTNLNYVLIGYNFYDLPLSLQNISKQSILNVLQIGNRVEIKTKTSVLSGIVDFVDIDTHQCSTVILIRLKNDDIYHTIELYQDHCESGWWYHNCNNSNPFESIDYITTFIN